MARYTVVATQALPAAAQDRLERDYRARMAGADEGLATAAAGAEALIVTPVDAIDAELISALPATVRAIASFSVGFEHVDLEAARSRGIVVTNTPGVLTDATAEIALLLMLGCTRRAGEGERLVRAGQWAGWYPTHMMGRGLNGKRLGIVGMGRIGRAVAHRARAFGMEIHYHSRTRLGDTDAPDATYHADLDALLGVSDVLSLHCPLTADTHHLLNQEAIARLPDGAFVINTARGPVVHDEALIAALRAGKLGGAGLDVFEGEPSIHPGYLALDNVVLLPHLGSATIETRTAMGMLVLDNLDAVFRGAEPPARVV